MYLAGASGGVYSLITAHLGRQTRQTDHFQAAAADVLPSKKKELMLFYNFLIITNIYLFESQAPRGWMRETGGCALGGSCLGLSGSGGYLFTLNI